MNKALTSTSAIFTLLNNQAQPHIQNQIYDSIFKTGLNIMPKLRSATSTQGRNMAGARALWRATGMTDGDFGKPMLTLLLNLCLAMYI
mgnify:CR=1 FL=1